MKKEFEYLITKLGHNFIGYWNAIQYDRRKKGKEDYKIYLSSDKWSIYIEWFDSSVIWTNRGEQRTFNLKITTTKEQDIASRYKLVSEIFNDNVDTKEEVIRIILNYLKDEEDFKFHLREKKLERLTK